MKFHAVLGEIQLSTWFQKYLLPGFVFQGVVIGGGYSTGRELVEFFLPHGPIGGLLSMLVAALVWSAVMAVSFELCRITRSYDYRSFFSRLLGRYWVLFEVVLLSLMFLILSVVGAAAGEITSNLLGMHVIVGTLLLLVTVGFLVFFGNTVIERFMGAWSIALYATYALLIVWSFAAFGGEIGSEFSRAWSLVGQAGAAKSAWIVDGFRYAGYNLAIVATIFFCLRHVETRTQAVSAGVLAGFIGMVPAALFFTAMMAYYPEIGSQSVPSTFLLDHLGSSWFAVVFQVVILGTLIQTGTGLVHAVNERVAATYRDSNRTMPRLMRPAVAIGMLVLAVVVASSVGLVSLIAHGYGLLTYAVLAVFVLPVMTVGFARIRQAAVPGQG